MIAQSILLEAYQKMLTIRVAENLIAEDFRNNKIFSFYHSSVGQEGAAVGVCMALEREDRVYGNHRSHGHYIAKGGNLFRMFAEIYGSLEGCCKGYGGSMHMLDKSCGFMGSTPILGRIVPISAGSAFEQKISNSKNITVCFFGDGASEEGVVYETMNLAATWKIPVLFVVEDNLWAVNTPHKDRRSSLFSRKMLCDSLGVRYLDADGGNFEHVYSQTKMLVNKLRNGHGPALLHVCTYREMAHSGPINDESVRHIYGDTIESRKADDPITNIENILHEMSTARTLEIRREVGLTVMAAWSEAKSKEATK